MVEILGKIEELFSNYLEAVDDQAKLLEILEEIRSLVDQQISQILSKEITAFREFIRENSEVLLTPEEIEELKRTYDHPHLLDFNIRNAGIFYSGKNLSNIDLVWYFSNDGSIKICDMKSLSIPKKRLRKLIKKIFSVSTNGYLKGLIQYIIHEKEKERDIHQFESSGF